jgi:N6-L-threonylcarbamoyladenine synthase
VEVLVKKSLTAAAPDRAGPLVVAGGVGANRLLRAQLDAACAKARRARALPRTAPVHRQRRHDRLAAAMRLQAGHASRPGDYAFDVKPRWPLDQL